MADTDPLDEIIVEVPEGDIVIEVSAPSYEIAEIESYAMPGPPGGGGGGSGGGPETEFDIGSVTGGTLTPLAANGKFQRLMNNGDFILNPPSPGVGADSFEMFLTVENGPTAGDIFTNIPPWTHRFGDAFNLVEGQEFLVHITVTPTIAMATVTRLTGLVAGVTGADFSLPDNSQYIPLLFEDI